MENVISNLAVRLHQAVVEPLLVLALRGKRLAMFGEGRGEIEEVSVEWHRPDDCRAPCPLHSDKVPKLLRRYARVDARQSGLRLTPMLIRIPGLPDVAAFDAALKQRSSRTLSKVRAAARKGYHARQFMLAEIFDPQLECGSNPRLKRGPQPVRERAPDVLRADEIEFRLLGPLGPRKLDRIEVGFVQGQASTLLVEAL